MMAPPSVYLKEFVPDHIADCMIADILLVFCDIVTFEITYEYKIAVITET